MKKEIIKVFSTFSGGRGADIGSKLAGGTTLYHVDNWPPVLRTFDNHRVENKPVSEHYVAEGIFDLEDIVNVNHEHIKYKLLGLEGHLEAMGGMFKHLFFDYAIGGSPCVCITGLNRKRAFWLFMNKLMLHNVRVMCEEAKAKVVVIEQVPGLLTNDTKWDVDMREFYEKFLITLFKGAGKEYNWESCKMNAAHYGSYQDRERLMFMGVHKSFGIRPSFPLPRPIQEHQYLHSLLPDVSHIFNSAGKRFLTDYRLAPTLTSEDIEVISRRVRRNMTIEEKMLLADLPGYNFTGVSQKDIATILGNMIQVKFAEALCRHIMEEILPYCK